MNSPLKPRRKPSQSRAWMTSLAIQDALVLLLAEKDFAHISMRDIAHLAGVGLGTLYLYFPNKESIAAVTIRRWLRGLARRIEKARAGENDDLHARLHAIVATHVQAICEQPATWRALMQLERRLTSPLLYRQMYSQFVHVVATSLATATDWPRGRDVQPVAFLAFSLLCSATRDGLLALQTLPSRDSWTRQLQIAITAGVHCALRTDNADEGSIFQPRLHPAQT